MRVKASHGFTLMEVLVAVVILALTGTAALKLALLAQNGLKAAKQKEDFLDEARRIQIAVKTGALPDSGTSGDIKWQTAEKTREMFGENFGRLNFSGDSFDNSESREFKWKELTVQSTKNGKLILAMPTELKSASDDKTTSNDKTSASSDKVSSNDMN
jgi:prepilin-type N-terminal cleavage/methylation domain-containing protein